MSILLDRFLAVIERQALRIAQISTGDTHEAMDLVHVARSAAPSRPPAPVTAISSGPLIES